MFRLLPPIVYICIMFNYVPGTSGFRGRRVESTVKRVECVEIPRPERPETDYCDSPVGRAHRRVLSPCTRGPCGWLVTVSIITTSYPLSTIERES